MLELSQLDGDLKELSCLSALFNVSALVTSNKTFFSVAVDDIILVS